MARRERRLVRTYNLETATYNKNIGTYIFDVAPTTRDDGTTILSHLQV